MTAYPTLDPSPRVESLPGVHVTRVAVERPLAVEKPLIDTVTTAQAGPQRIPTAQLTHLRHLMAAYQAALDATLIGMGFSGGCKVDLARGIVYPPEK